jgi:membrane protease YdiL (CAAX protease family)
MEPGRRTGIRAFIAGHPYRGAILFWILFFLLNIIGGLLAVPLLGQPAFLIIVASLIVAAGGVVIVWHLGWWKQAGYAGAGRLLDLPLYLLPAGMALLPLIDGIGTTTAATVAVFGILSIVVALAEETFFRGLILQALIPAGVLRAVMLSALLFGLPHLLNSVGGMWDPSFTLVDTVAAFGIGIAFAALVIRTRTIWPPVFLHALINFIALVSLGSITVPAQTPAQLATTAAAGVVMAVYGLFLLHRLPGQQSSDARS